MKEKTTKRFPNEENKITEEEYMLWHIKRGTPKHEFVRMVEDFREDFLMKPFYELENGIEEPSEIEEKESISKRMNDINTFQAHENEVYLAGKDEFGKEFTICFDSYDFLDWIDSEHLEYIKQQLINHINKK